MSFKSTLADNDILSNAVTNFERVKPGLGVVVGLIGIGVSTWLMWRAGRKHDQLMEEIRADFDEVHKDRPIEVVDADTGKPVKAVGPSGLTAKQYNKKLIGCCARNGWKLIKTYGVPIGIQLVSGALIFEGFHIEHERFTGASAAAAIAVNGYSNYRKKAIEKYGEEADQELRFGIKDKNVQVPDLNKNGEQKLDKDGNPIWHCSSSIVNDITGIIRGVFASSKKDAKKAVAYLMLCEHFQMQNQYGPNAFYPTWIYKDGKLIPDRELFKCES